MSGGPITPVSAIPVTGNVLRGNYTGPSGTSLQELAMSVYGNLTTDGVWRLRFVVPAVVPPGIMHLRLLGLSNATAGVSKVNVKWGVIRAGLSPSGAQLFSEGALTVDWNANPAGRYKKLDIALDAQTVTLQPLDVIVVDLTFEASGWTVASSTFWHPTIIWLDEVTDPEEPEEPAPSGPLSWRPDDVCPLTNPIPINVPAAGGVYNLAANGHYEVTLNGGSGQINGRVNFNGNGTQRVRIKGGGRIANAADGLPGTGNGSSCLDIMDVDIAYVEGVVADKLNKRGDCFIFRGTPGGRLYLQNCIARNNNYDTASGGVHGDALQLQSQCRGLYVDRFTFKVWAQAILWNSSFDDQHVTGPALLDRAIFRNCDGVVYDTNLNPATWNPGGSHSLYWVYESCSHKKYPIEFTNCYAWDEQMSGNRHTLQNLVVPKTNYSATAGCGMAISGDAYLGSTSWHSTMAAAGCTGSVKGGRPPGGDFVKHSGLGYVTPGYV